LDGSTDRAEDDSPVEGSWLAPFVENFIPESITLSLVELRDLFKSGGVLCHKGAFLKERDMVGHVGIAGKLFDIVEECMAGDTGKRVLDSGWVLGLPMTRAEAVRSRYLAVILLFRLTEAWRPRSGS